MNDIFRFALGGSFASLLACVPDMYAMTPEPPFAFYVFLPFSLLTLAILIYVRKVGIDHD